MTGAAIQREDIGSAVICATGAAVSSTCNEIDCWTFLSLDDCLLHLQALSLIELPAVGDAALGLLAFALPPRLAMLAIVKYVDLDFSSTWVH